jgi:hypothetical protein
MKGKRLTKRQKFIAAATVPTYGGLASREEVRQIKLLARGHYWDEGEDFLQFCAFSPSGKRQYFEYEWYSWGTTKQKKRWKTEAAKAARLWARGKCKEALELDRDCYEQA